MGEGGAGWTTDTNHITQDAADPVPDGLLVDGQADCITHVRRINHGDLVDLVRGAEAVEEVNKGDRGAQCGEVGDQRQVLCLLDRV